MRPFVLEALKLENSGQFMSLCRKVNDVVEKHKLGAAYRPDLNSQIPRLYKGLIGEIFWDLIIERIITLGVDESNAEYPWYRVTEFGRDLLHDENIVLRDVDGYIGALKQLIPEVDSGLLQYMSEGFNCHRQGLYQASIVMMGAGAERLSLLVLESLHEAETDPGRKSKCKKLLDNGSFYKILEHFNYRVNEIINNEILPFSVHEGFGVQGLALIDLIRQHRNDSVHPRRGSFTRGSVSMILNSMPLLIERFYKIKAWLDSNKL